MPTATMPMPKKKNEEKPPADPPTPSPSPRKTAPVQIESDLARWASTIASHDRIAISELLSPFLRPFLLTHYKRVKAEMDAEVEGQDGE